MYYSDDIVEEVRNRNDIVDVISGYVKLKKKGSTYFGLCPFHHEKSPSFSVNGQRQIFHCFGCGEGGNVFTFLMKYEHYSFPEAVQVLAERAGMSLPQAEYTPEEKQRAGLKAKLYEVNKEAALYYHHLLKSDKGVRAYEYLNGRGLKDETIVKFGLGYSSNYKDDLYRYLRGKGYQDEVLKESGLFVYRERGVYDKFNNRVMFPIMDINHKVIGFGGRVMGEGEPKYLNSPETALFDKSRNLYGMNYARTSRRGSLLICEGYMDVIALHQAGFDNAVASLGTAFTSRQCLLLKRYTDQVYLTYDSDGAGVKAALRALPMMKEAGLNTKVVNMRPYKDPDEFIKNEGGDAYEQRIEQARNGFLYEIDRLREQFNLQEPDGRTAFYRETAKRLLEFEDELERNVYLETVGKEYQIPEGDLRKMVNKLAYTYQGKERKQTADREPEETGGASEKRGKKQKESGIIQAQRILLTWILDEPELLKKLTGIISEDDFTEPLYRKTAGLLFWQIRNGEMNPAGIMDQFENEEEHREVSALFHMPLGEELSRSEKERALNETVLQIRKHSLDQQLRTVTDVKKMQEIIGQQQKLQTLHISL